LAPSSGWGRYTLELIAALDEVGVEAVLITTADSPGDGGLRHVGCFPILPSLTDGRRWVTPRSLAWAPMVRRLVRDCDVLHCTVEPFAPVGAMAGRPLVITAHGTYLPRSLRRRGVGWLLAWAVRRAGAVICVSTYTERQVREALPGARTVVVPNGVDWRRFAAPASTPEHKRGPVILGVGQVKARKGYDVVAQVMQAVRQAHPNAEYVIIGDTESEPELAARLSDTPGVRVLGRVDDETLRAWYHHADLFALTPVNVGEKFEGFGLVYLEAGAAGLPAVGARGSGAEEAILHEKSGLLVPQNDPDATAAAMLRLLDDAELRARLGEGARRHAETHGWDHVAEQMRTIYARAAKKQASKAEL
jgi:phosphatidylinositol alpha-1,6-mannosyltransferase